MERGSSSWGDLERIARRQAELGEFEAARETARQISHDSLAVRARALDTVATFASKAGNHALARTIYSEAANIAVEADTAAEGRRRIQSPGPPLPPASPWQRHAHLRAVAESQARAGDLGGAALTLHEHGYSDLDSIRSAFIDGKLEAGDFTAAERVRDQITRGRHAVSLEIARQKLKTNDWRGALTISRTVAYEIHQLDGIRGDGVLANYAEGEMCDLLLKVVQERISAGDLATAAEIASSIPFSFIDVRMRAYISVGNAWLAAGNTPLGRQFFAVALTYAELAEQLHSGFIRRVFEAQFSARLFSDAQLSYEREPRQSDLALSGLELSIKMGLVEHARKFLQDADREKGSSYLAEGLAKAASEGRLDIAKSLLANVSEDKDRDTVILAIAHWRGTQGDLPGARQELVAANLESQWPALLGKIAELANTSARLERLLSHTSERSLRENLQRQLRTLRAEEQLKAGKIDQAVGIIAMDMRTHCNHVCRNIVAVLSRSGRISEALSIVRFAAESARYELLLLIVQSAPADDERAILLAVENAFAGDGDLAPSRISRLAMALWETGR